VYSTDISFDRSILGYLMFVILTVDVIPSNVMGRLWWKELGRRRSWSFWSHHPGIQLARLNSATETCVRLASNMVEVRTGYLHVHVQICLQIFTAVLICSIYLVQISAQICCIDRLSGFLTPQTVHIKTEQAFAYFQEFWNLNRNLLHMDAMKSKQLIQDAE